MRECTKCGGSRVKDYAVGCDHEFPEPTEVKQNAYGSTHRLGGASELQWEALGSDVRGVRFVMLHPTREGAIAAWHAEYRRRKEAPEALKYPDQTHADEVWATLFQAYDKAMASALLDEALRVPPRQSTTRLDKVMLADGSILDVSGMECTVTYWAPPPKPERKIEVGARVRDKSVEHLAAGTVSGGPCQRGFWTVAWDDPDKGTYGWFDSLEVID
jgi:hypothetical protein